MSPLKGTRHTSTRSLPGLALLALASACSPRGSEEPARSAPVLPSQEPAAAPPAAASPSPAKAPAPAGPASGLSEVPLRSGVARPRGGPVAGFTDVTRESRVLFRHRRGDFDPQLSNIMPWISSIGAAAAVSDFDLDGDLDLYVTTSRKGFPNGLFRNDGGLRFTDVAKEAGVAGVNDADGVSMDAAFADLDSDGDDELYVVEWGRNRLFRNEGTGRFADATEASGTGDRGNGNCVLPFDHDADGLLDLYVCNYFPPVDLSRLDTTRIMHDSFEAARNGGSNVLFRNAGGLRFENVAHQLHLDDSGWSLDAGISDIDNDGDQDVYVANDFGQDRVFLSNGDGTFADVTERAIGHETFKGMNIDFGDFNGDGFTDGYVSNITTAEYLKEGNMLLLNAGNGTFSNVSGATGTFDGGWGWCARFFDFDQDGHLDILAVNGFVTAGPVSYWEDLATIAVEPDFDPADSSEWPAMGQKSLSGNEPARLFRNRGDGSFEEVAQKYGIADRRDGRGIALGDFDDDGDQDVYIANQDAPGALYRNDVGNTHRFVVLSLEGTRSNRNAIGARVELVLAAGQDPSRLLREVNGVNGYASQSAYRLHFGVGQAERIESLRVFWPSGAVQELRDLPVDRHFRIVETGDSLPAEERRKLYFGVPRAGAEAASRTEGIPAAAPAVLLDLEERLRRKPCNAELANRYRSLCVDGGRFDRSIELFRSLARTHSRHTAARLQLALAFVDKIPSLEGDVLGQGSLAKEALNELQVVEDAEPDSYAVHYASGMNHLYWPESLKHFDDAVRHFEKCLEIQEARASAGARPEAHHAEVYRALGDAHVKGKRLEAARAAWTEGLALFPGHAGLEARLAAPDAQLSETIKDERGLKRRIDSSLAWLAEENGLARAEAALRSAPGDRALLNAYRSEAYELDRSPRAVSFLEELVARPGAPAELRLQLALALADRISSIGAATVEAFRLADRILEELRAYRARAPGDWLGPYFEGVCHLFRPPSAAAARAARAFEEAARLARREDGTPRVPYPGQALGDALVCAGDPEGAVRVWKQAAAAFPHERAAKARLECPPEALRARVRADYDLARGIPTDLEALEDREGEILGLEASLREAVRPEAATRYRALARRGDDPERAIRFFQALLKEKPRSANARVQLALSLMDRIPDRDLGSVRKGLLSSDALAALEEAVAVHADSWGLHYTVGLIHLNWFTKLKHVPHAARAFERCLAIGKGRERQDPRFALVYQALGDAIVKDRETPGSFSRGRRCWKGGLDLFPDDRGLQKRMGLTALMVNRYVEDLRSWASVQDTATLSDLIGDLPDLPPGPSG